MAVVSDFQDIISSRVHTVEFGAWLRSEIAPHIAAAETFFSSAYDLSRLPKIASTTETGLILERLGAPEGPHLLAWLGEREQHVASRALAWATHNAKSHPAWSCMPIGAQRFLLAICGVEMDTQPSRIPEAIGVVRARLGPRPGGGPLLCASELAHQGETPDAIRWPPGLPPQPSAIRIENALRLAGYQWAGRGFLRMCRRQEIHVPASKVLQLLFIRRVAPPGAINPSKLPDDALLLISAALAWAARNCTEASVWEGLKQEEKDLLCMCGGTTLPPSGADRRMLESFRLQIFVSEACRARFPDAREVTDDSTEALLPGPILAATGGWAPYCPVSRLGNAATAHVPRGNEPAVSPALFSSLCLQSDACRATLATGTKQSGRLGILGLHHFSWGRGPADVPALSPDEFFAAVVWGEHVATTLEPEPWPNPTFSQVVWLAAVFGCESLTVGEDGLTTVWNTLLAWLQERDPVMPFGATLPHPAPAGPLSESLGPSVGPSPGEFFLNSLLTAGFRWPVFDTHASAILDLGNFFPLLPVEAGARQLRCEAAAAVAWCWVMKEVPTRTPSSPWLLVPRPALIFLIERLQPRTGLAQASTKRLATEARHLSLEWWVLKDGLVRLLTEHLPRHARPGAAWEEPLRLYPVVAGLGLQPSYFVIACSMASLHVPNSYTGCQNLLLKLAPNAKALRAHVHPALMRECAAAIVWASAALVTLVGDGPEPDLWLPTDIFPTLQSLFPDAASSWEWNVGLGLKQFWITCGKVWRDHGICRHVPCLDVRIDRTGCSEQTSDLRAGTKRPRAELQCLDPAGDLVASAGGSAVPASSTAAHNVRSLLSFNTALVAERDAAVVAAHNLAARCRVLFSQFHQATESKETSNRLLASCKARVAVLESEAIGLLQLSSDQADSIRELRGKLEAHQKLDLAHATRERGLEGQLADLRAEAETARNIRARLEGVVAKLESEQTAAAATATEVLEAAGALSQDEHDAQTRALEAEILTLKDRVQDLERELRAFDPDADEARPDGSQSGSRGSPELSPVSPPRDWHTASPWEAQ